MAVVVFPMIATQPARATTPAVVTVFAPTAYYTGEFGPYSYGLNDAKKLDSSSITLLYGSVVFTWGFVSPYYSHYWSPYGNRSNFPPDNATIVSVHALAIMLISSGMMAKIGITAWNNSTEYDLQSPVYSHTTGMYVAYEYNMTSAFNWTPTILKSTAVGGPNGLQLWVNVLGSTGTVFVDYLGLNYTWIPAAGGGGGGAGGGGGGGGGTVGPIALPGAMGIIGMVGFIGMIGTPAISIWFYRHEGGSKLMAAVTALLGFTVCGGLFLASINGG